MIVFTEMKVGCPWWAIPSAMAASSASRSFPSSTVSVCHPKASYRAARSSVKARLVSPSIVTWLSSYRKTRLSSARWPASDDASPETPSIRSPSETSANTRNPAGFAEARGEVLGGDRHPDRVPRALAERAGRHLDTGRVAVLGMAGREAPPLAEALELVERQVIARQVEQRVEQHAAVPRREDESVTAGPGRVGRVVAQVARPEHVRHRGGAHGEARMARFCLLDRVHRQGAEGVDCQLVDVVVRP